MTSYFGTSVCQMGLHFTSDFRPFSPLKHDIIYIHLQKDYSKLNPEVMRKAAH